MKILFIGGTGIISSAASKLALELGHDLYHINRNQSHRKISGITQLTADIRNPTETKKVLGSHSFDVVVDWISFVPSHVESNIELFEHRAGQYVFISSASAYQKPVEKLPITEETPLVNPFWQYSRDKADCEALLMHAYNKSGFPATIVRPSHTYDQTLIPFAWRYTTLDRMLTGKEVIIHGDGTSLWVLTHNTDFAVGITGLFGKKEAIGQAYHITSDELLSWNRIFQLFADELGVLLKCVHIPSEFIAQFDQEIGDGLLGDKSHSVIFDNSKIKSIVPDFHCKIPFAIGVKEIVSWYHDNKSWQVVDNESNHLMDRIITTYRNGLL